MRFDQRDTRPRLDHDGEREHLDDWLEADRRVPGKRSLSQSLRAPADAADLRQLVLAQLREALAASRRNLDRLDQAIAARDFDGAEFAASWVGRYLEAVDRLIAAATAIAGDPAGLDLAAATRDRDVLGRRGAELVARAPHGAAPRSAALEQAAFAPESFADVAQDREQQRAVWLARLDEAEAPPGEPLPRELRDRLEQAAGADLSDVRVHTGSASARATEGLNAHAFTIGRRIHLAPDTYQPGTPAWESLLAHEVAHALQQSGAAPAAPGRLALTSPGGHLEAEADRFAAAFAAGARAPVSAGAAPAAVARKERRAGHDDVARTVVDNEHGGVAAPSRVQVRFKGDRVRGLVTAIAKPYRLADVPSIEWLVKEVQRLRGLQPMLARVALLSVRGRPEMALMRSECTPGGDVIELPASYLHAPPTVAMAMLVATHIAIDVLMHAIEQKARVGERHLERQREVGGKNVAATEEAMERYRASRWARNMLQSLTGTFGGLVGAMAASALGADAETTGDAGVLGELMTGMMSPDRRTRETQAGRARGRRDRSGGKRARHRAGRSATRRPGAAVDPRRAWDTALRQLRAGGIPPADLLPATDGNRAGLRRLADIDADPTIPPAVRAEFRRELAAVLGKMKSAPEDLHEVLRGIVYSAAGRRKYQRRGPELPSERYVTNQLGGLKRLIALRALMQPGMLSRSFYYRARRADPSLPDYDDLDWDRGAQKVVELIKTGRVTFDPEKDLLSSGIVEGRGKGDSAWFFAGRDVDVSDVGRAQSQLAVGRNYLDGYVVVELRPDRALPDPATGRGGASRPTALDLTNDPLGMVNPDRREPVGRTVPQAPGLPPVREVVVPPMPMSAMSRRTYVPAGGGR